MSVAIRVWETAGAVHCKMVIPLRAEIGGSFTLVATIESATVVDAIRRSGLQLSKEEIGSLFGSIGKFAGKIGKVSVLKKALSLGKALVNSPLVSMIAPGAAASIRAAAGAAKLIAASKGSDKNKAAKAKMALIAAQAQAKAENGCGRQLPLPSGFAGRSLETRGAYRYLVTVARLGMGPGDPMGAGGGMMTSGDGASCDPQPAC
jgi:hypothetical protein